jgi:hypothetical protein
MRLEIQRNAEAAARWELLISEPGNNRVATARDGESDAEAEARQQEADQKAATIAAEEAKREAAN